MTDTQGTVLNQDALAWILSTPQGRKVIWGILGFSGLYQNPRVVGDPEATQFNCGSLNVGLMLIADCMTVSPDLTAMMTKEQGNDDNTRPEQPSTDRPEQPASGPEQSDASLGFTRYEGPAR